MEVNGHIHSQVAFIPVPIGKGAAWAPSWPGREGEERNLCLWRESNPDSAVAQPEN
jgi:hypothetical protein